jgi:O-antigen/teichoic acid export membrane protein
MSISEFPEQSISDRSLGECRSRADRVASARKFIVAKLQRVVESLTAQGFTTAINLLYGILCVRLLSVDGYAKFSLVFAFQTSLSLLADVGSTSALAPLVGERINDLQLIADYVASLRQLSVRLFSVLAAVTMVAFPLIVMKQHWGGKSVAFLVSMLIIFVWFARARGAYGAVLILRRERAAWYRPPMIVSVVALFLLVAARATHVLNEYVAILISVAANVCVTGVYYFRARRVLGTTGQPSPQKRRAIVRLIMPSMPNLVFVALQAQVSIMLITLFGRTSGVATVGALTRLGQVFALFNQINPVLIEPYFAKLSALRLKSHYLGAVITAAFVGLAMVALVRVWPELFLWVLGPKYAHYHSEVVLVTIMGAVYYLSGLIFCINTARRFIYWWSNISIIILTISVQALFLWKADLGTVRAVLLFNIFSILATLLVTISCSIYGFICGPRYVEGT